MKIARGDIYKDIFFLLLIAVIAYWPVSFMLFSAKGDAINYFLAMRYNSSEAIQHGYFPYWTSYINMGYPLHADIQSGAWNPLVLVMSVFRQYDIYWLHTEIILINFIAGLSMYHLLRYLGLERRTTLAIAVAYMLNGYITDAGQFLNWLYAAAILPFVVLCMIRAFKTFTIRHAFYLGLSHALMFLCAYPADSILLSYVILFYAAGSCVRLYQAGGWQKALQLCGKVAGIALISFIVITLPALISFAEFFPLIQRGEGVSLATAQINSLAPANLLSLVYPWSTMKGSAFAQTDPLIRNCYIGIFVLLLAVHFIFMAREKSFVQKFLVFLFLFFLWFSLGSFGGLRAISYYILPLMDTFRHPANAKLFFMFALQVMAAFSFDELAKTVSFNDRFFKKALLGTVVISVIVVFISLVKSHIPSAFSGLVQQSGNFSTAMKELRDQMDFYDLLLLNASLVFLLTLTAWLLLRRHKLKKFMLVLVCLDMVLTAQFMLPLTYVRKASPKEVSAILQQQPKGYPLPDLQSSLASLSVGGEDHFPVIGCLNPYNKKPSRTDYVITPSNTATHDQFWDQVDLRNRIMQYPLIWFADTVFRQQDSLSFIQSQRKAAILNDTIAIQSPQNSFVVVRDFKPGHYAFHAGNANQSLLVLMQNHYPRWQAFIDEEPASIHKTNISFMSVVVPAGEHDIEFVYNKGILPVLSIVSLVFALGGIVYFQYWKS